MRIILGYAPQENETTEVREQFFTELEIEVNECKAASDLPIIMGDMNAKIEYQDEKTFGKSSNGKMLLELVENQEIEILNFDKRCKGKWTHVIMKKLKEEILI